MPSRTLRLVRSVVSVVSVREHKRLIERTQHAVASGSYLWDVFVSAIRGKKLQNPITNDQIVDGLRVIRLLELARHSSDAARTLPVPQDW